MFIGEYLCFGIYHLKAMYKKTYGELPGLNSDSMKVVTTGENLKTDIHPVWIAIPAALDLIASSLIFISLTMIDASVYQMLRGLIVIVVPILSVLLLGK
jgi:drug/metabolite transporter (DMT)-like permease